MVPDFQLSLAIGREGQNARLAARLTGWRIDIHSDSEGSAAAAASEAGSAAESRRVRRDAPPQADRPVLHDTPEREG